MLNTGIAVHGKPVTGRIQRVSIRVPGHPHLFKSESVVETPRGAGLLFF